jgi:ATP-dependent Clp protease ATP-binding subunit ClpA
VFKRFTQRARSVVVLAQEEARALGHDYIGTEHILLGLLREEEGLGGLVLTELGLTADATRAQIEQVIGRGDHTTVGQIPFTPRAKKVLELSLREAIGLGHDYIGTEHILLGLAAEDEGAAARILLDFGAEGERIRNAVYEHLAVRADTVSTTRRSRRASRRQGVTVGRHAIQWEYRVERQSPIDQSWLNELGADGWELVDISGDILVFKRRRLPGSLRAAG